MVSDLENSEADYTILCVLPVIGQPRHAKRISMLKQGGFSVEAVAFEREYHRGRLPDCDVRSLGKIKQGKYFQRLITLFGSLFTLRRNIRKGQLVYTFGLDMAFISILASIGLRRPVILEVGDIERIQVSTGLKGKIIRLFDKFVANTIDLLVSTAPGYIDGYYSKWLKIKPVSLVVENKLESTGKEASDSFGIMKPTGKPLTDRPLRIGYFGLLRCEKSWQVLESLATARPNGVEIVVAGRPKEPTDLVDRANQIPNIEYRGEYLSPDDLPELYDSVDIVWACYPSPGPGEWNWRWARTNRFYESCYFRTPVIALAESADAVEVERLDIGITVDVSEIDDVVETLSKISATDLECWERNILNLPRSVYEYTDETIELREAVNEILNSNLKCN